jgi:hypothetical protein
MIDTDVLPLAASLLVAVVILAVMMNRPPPPGGKPRGRGAMGAACLLVLTLAGCANPLNSARLVVGSAADFYNATEPRLEAQEKAQLDACLTEATQPAQRPACVEGVVTAWAPTKAALVALDGAISAARLGLLVAAASDATGKPVDAAEVQRLVLAVIEAVTTLQRLDTPRPSPAPLAAPSATGAPVGGSR